MEEILGLVDQYGNPLKSNKGVGGLFRKAGDAKINPNAIQNFLKGLNTKASGATDLVTKGVGKGTPYVVGIDALLELSDDSEPISKNVADAVGSGAGTALGLKVGAGLGAFGGPAAPVTVPLMSLLGAYLFSEAGGEIGGGLYNAINPDGVKDYKIKQIRKAGEIEAAKYEVLRNIERENRKAIREEQNQNLMITGGF